ncbi:MAG: CBS domain-containing protein [Anaerolineales bacterium]|nr:CBS domain-containing protein [Anaerolineales bacterium]
MYTNVTVRQILHRKGNQVWSVKPDDSVLDALRFMDKKNIGAVVVIEDDILVGIFSERDYARKVALKGRSEAETLVRDVMTEKVIGVGLDHGIEACLALMTGKFIRHLPVVHEGSIIGVISIGDVVKEILAEQNFVIDQLVNYISGGSASPTVPGPSETDLP